MNNCKSSNCSCNDKKTGIDRREFLRTSGIGASLMMVPGIPVFAGPFDENDYLKYIPADKKLDPDWIKSLFERGKKETYTDPAALNHIGMPVGGLFAGTVYLSGDGRLWLWDIFNRDQEGIQPKTIEYEGRTVRPRDGANFVEPAVVKSPFKQGFELIIGDQVRALNQEGFTEIEFDGRYPMAIITFKDPGCPVEVRLEAFSPFIPLNTDDSSLPATVMSYTLINKSDQTVKCSIKGFTENPVCIDSAEEYECLKQNRIVKSSKMVSLLCEALPKQVDHIEGSDNPTESKPLSELRDYGTFCLSILGKEDIRDLTSDILAGQITANTILEPNQEKQLDFAFSWHFPNFYGRDFGGVKVGHYYASRFDSALDVAKYLSKNKNFLFDTTRKWVNTWYDSTLPYWLLDRTMSNTATLATTTCYRHENGRFWAWEGIGCCTGTCTHVWHYAQAVGRVFPEIERDQRERVDFGMALKENGEIGYRALLESSMGPAFDGQCGRILGAYREHLMSANDAFLKRNWEAVRKAIKYMIDKDLNFDGILEGSQPNTLDASWYGKISFISSLYIAALRAGEKMAREMKDDDFAEECLRISEKGAANILELYNDEFFIQLEDPDHKDVIGVGTGCYIDQIFGQTWAHWTGMGHIFSREKQLSALRSLWRYNFVPDVGPFRRRFKAGRWYAMAGDGGLLMCTWPKGGKRDKWEDQWQFMYFNECMSGFEWQAASHMIYEGIDNPDILQNGLAVSRAIHDRYSALLRNPYNEIECSDHYARAMASYGVFQAVCGFNYHGPKGMIEFDPRLTAADFRSAFITSEGWGTYSQKMESGQLIYNLELKYGQLNLTEWIIRMPAGDHLSQWKLNYEGKNIDVLADKTTDGKISLHFENIKLKRNETLVLKSNSYQ